MLKPIVILVSALVLVAIVLSYILEGIGEEYERGKR